MFIPNALAISVSSDNIGSATVTLLNAGWRIVGTSSEHGKACRTITAIPPTPDVIASDIMRRRLEAAYGAVA